MNSFKKIYFSYDSNKNWSTNTPTYVFTSTMYNERVYSRMNKVIQQRCAGAVPATQIDRVQSPDTFAKRISIQLTHIDSELTNILLPTVIQLLDFVISISLA